MSMARSRRRTPPADSVDFLRLAQADLVAANAQLALAMAGLANREAKLDADVARIQTEFEEIKALHLRLVDMIDRLPGKIGFGKGPETQ